MCWGLWFSQSPKEESGTIEPSTMRSYRSEAKLICRYIGGEKP